MKKLLSFLWAISFSAVLVTEVTACKPNQTTDTEVETATTVDNDKSNMADNDENLGQNKKEYFLKLNWREVDKVPDWAYIDGNNSIIFTNYLRVLDKDDFFNYDIGYKKPTEAGLIYVSAINSKNIDVNFCDNKVTITSERNISGFFTIYSTVKENDKFVLKSVQITFQTKLKV